MRICSESGCGLPHQGRGLCNKHYQRRLRLEARQKREAAGLFRTRAKCIVQDCGRFVNGNGLCNKHYQRARVQGLLAGLPPCSRDKCQRKAHVRGLCNLHYQASLRRKRGSEERQPPPIDGRYLHPNGYAQVRRVGHPNAAANGMVFEHRLVMSEIIGRPLTPDENVHHKNGDRADNRPENLELWSTSQPRGQRVEDKIRWCREFLAKYEGFKQP